MRVFSIDEIKSLNLPLYIEHIDKGNLLWEAAYYINVFQHYGITLDQAREIVSQIN